MRGVHRSAVTVRCHERINRAVDPFFRIQRAQMQTAPLEIMVSLGVKTPPRARVIEQLFESSKSHANPFQLQNYLLFLSRNLWPLNVSSNQAIAPFVQNFAHFWYTPPEWGPVPTQPQTTLLKRVEINDFGSPSISIPHVADASLVAIALLRSAGYQAYYSHAACLDAAGSISEDHRIVILDREGLLVFSLDMVNTSFGRLTILSDVALQGYIDALLLRAAVERDTQQGKPQDHLRALIRAKTKAERRFANIIDSAWEIHLVD